MPQARNVLFGRRLILPRMRRYRRGRNMLLCFCVDRCGSGRCSLCHHRVSRRGRGWFRGRGRLPRQFRQQLRGRERRLSPRCASRHDAPRLANTTSSCLQLVDDNSRAHRVAPSSSGFADRGSEEGLQTGLGSTEDKCMTSWVASQVFIRRHWDQSCGSEGRCREARSMASSLPMPVMHKSRTTVSSITVSGRLALVTAKATPTMA